MPLSSNPMNAMLSPNENRGEKPTNLRLVQINLKHSISATENLLIYMKDNNIDISLIQEPWVNGECIRGLNTHEFNLLYRVPEKGIRPRSCILVRRSLTAFLLTNYSDEDTTTIQLESSNESLILTSAYLSHDKEIPSQLMSTLASRNQEAIFGCDANARHVAWGNEATNERGEYFSDFINLNNLSLHNRGNTPTFIFPGSSDTEGWSAILDVTLSKSQRFDLVENWQVSLENSHSDHRYITFEVAFKKKTVQPFRNPRRTDWKIFKKYISKNLKSSSKENLTISEIERETNNLIKTFQKAFKISTEISKPKPRRFPDYFTKDLIDLRRKMRTQFNISFKNGEWEEYRKLRNLYKSQRRKAKSEEWRRYCESIESTKDTARLRKILSKTHNSPAFIMNSEGKWAESSRETNEILLDTHFPGSKDCSSIEQTPTNELYTNNMGSQLVTCEKVLWAINTFDPYKSAGPDGIIPKMMQVTSDIVVPLLTNILRSCINLGFIPQAWREVRVIFIPKAGKSNHCTAKDFRPISLSSFVLKTMEKILDVYIRGLFQSNTISNTQHAYVKGKSVDTALHELVSKIESSTQHGQYTLAAFLDIEGAFNNVKLSAIVDSLIKIGVEKPVYLWISQMLRTRVINSTVGETTLRKLVDRGTPQGGVISPLLWLIVINNILVTLTDKRLTAVAYADDVAILCSGMFPNTLSERVQKALRLITDWAVTSGLNVNPAKTELVLFRKGYKIPSIKLPKLNGITLELSNQAKFLGVILDSRLTWKANLEDRVRKAQIAYYVCRRAFSNTWGLAPKLVNWIFTAVVRPILTYGATVWWKALLSDSNCKRLDRVTRSVCIGITGALRSTSTEALLNILSIQPIRLYTQYIASRTAARLSSVGLWKAKPYGHASILTLARVEIPRKVDTCITTINFSKNYTVRIPSRKDWREAKPIQNFETVIFTDGSKTKEGNGAGFILKHNSTEIVRQCHRLPNESSVFQCEIFAIKEACTYIQIAEKLGTAVAICVDSQAALKALDSPLTSSKLVGECKHMLNHISEKYSVTLIWVPGHCNIEGNEQADYLARCGAEKHISGAADVAHPIAGTYLQIDNKLKENHKRIWRSSNSIYKNVWGPPDPKSTAQLLKYDRKTIRTITLIVTGHWPIGRHARRLGILEGTACPGCGLAPSETDAHHFWCLCPALCRLRLNVLGSYWLNSTEELLNKPLATRLEFILKSKWLR